MTALATKPANLPVSASGLGAFVKAARLASAHAGDSGSLRRHETAQALVRMPEPSIAEHGAGRAAIARAIRSNVVALALATDEAARRAIAYSTRELCNALLSEPAPAPARVWWADHD